MIPWRRFKPRNKWVLVKSDPRVKQTRGGIFLTDAITQIERVMEGTGRILKIGDEAKEKAGIPLGAGDRIVFRGFLKDAFQEFERDEDGLTVFLLRIEDVLAVIDDNVHMGAVY